MSTENIQALLARKSQLAHDIDRAQTLIRTAASLQSHDANRKANLSIAGQPGYLGVDLKLTQQLATDALQALMVEQAALTEKLEAINTLLAD